MQEVNEYKEIFHKRLKATRKKLGLSQETVAAEIGITQSQLSKFELGTREPNIEQIGQLAKYYNVTIDWLFGHTTEKE